MNIDENKKNGLRLYSNQLEVIGTTGNYINQREVIQRFHVEPGHYLIIPSTFDEDRNGGFMLRVFTETKINSRYI